MEEVIAILQSLLPKLREANIVLAIENHDRFKAFEFARMVEESDKNSIGICLDSVNSMGAGEGVAEVLQTLLPYTVNLHLKDFTVKRVSHKMGFVVEGVPAGNGMLNIHWMMEEIRKTSRCQSAILELWTPPELVLDDTIAKEEQWVKESVNNLKGLF